MIKMMDEKERLERFEAMKAAIEEQHRDILEKMDRLRQAGRQKSATYMQLMSNKLTYENMLKLYQLYDIE